MKELYREPDLTRMGLLRSILETRGIATWIRNENEHSALGLARLSAPKDEPALCVVDEADFARALEILRDFVLGDEERSREEIACPACGEPNPGNFEICWNCGAGIGPTG
jgi:hypothetical protein